MDELELVAEVSIIVGEIRFDMVGSPSQEQLYHRSRSTWALGHNSLATYQPRKTVEQIF